MKILYFTLFFILGIFSFCKKKNAENHSIIGTNIPKITEESVDKTGESNGIDKGKVPVQSKSPKSTSVDFVTLLQKQPIQSLPFYFAPYLLDSLQKESHYDEILFEIAFQEIDSSLILNDLLRYKLTKNDIHADTEGFYPYYYSMLLANCDLSASFLYKRLPLFRDNMEVLLAATKIQDLENDFTRGLIFELIFYDIDSEKIANRTRIFTGGIAEYDNRYFEGFEIEEDYNKIRIKSYVGFEGESTTIERELQVKPDGNIVEIGQPVIKVEYNEQNYD